MMLIALRRSKMAEKRDPFTPEALALEALAQEGPMRHIRDPCSPKARRPGLVKLQKL